MSKFLGRHNYLSKLAQNSYKAIDAGVYSGTTHDYGTHDQLSLKKSILTCTHTPLITEIKFASPSRGTIYNQDIAASTIKDIATTMVEAGSIALSIVTQPFLFNGSPDYLSEIRRTVAVPILMKDIVVSDVQIDSAKRMGADCILLIMSIFDNNLAEGSIEKFADYANRRGLQVVFEAHKEHEYNEILKLNRNPKQNLVGINNRDLESLNVDINTTYNLLKKYDKLTNTIISESGISRAEEIEQLKRVGADAFLIGTSIMESADIRSKITDLSQST
jgi:indole-3-glycerol phosphate synthase